MSDNGRSGLGRDINPYWLVPLGALPLSFIGQGADVPWVVRFGLWMCVLLVTPLVAKVVLRKLLILILIPVGLIWCVFEAFVTVTRGVLSARASWRSWLLPAIVWSFDHRRWMWLAGIAGYSTLLSLGFYAVILQQKRAGYASTSASALFDPWLKISLVSLGVCSAVVTLSCLVARTPAAVHAQDVAVGAGRRVGRFGIGMRNKWRLELGPRLLWKPLLFCFRGLRKLRSRAATGADGDEPRTGGGQPPTS